MIEIIITLGVLVIIASLGLFISMDFFRGRSSHSEQETIVSLLQNARSQSLNNINQTRHGVHFDPTTLPLQYILFECASGCTNYVASSSDLIIKSSYGVTIKNPASPFDVIFEQLSGNSSPVSITVNNGVRDYIITVNIEGQIDWQ